MQNVPQNIKSNQIVIEKMTSSNTNTPSRIKVPLPYSGTCNAVNPESSVLPDGCMCTMNKSWRQIIGPKGNVTYSCQ